MDKKYTPNGWIEIVTKGIIVTLKDCTPINTAGGWVDFCKRHPNMNKGGRNHCERCDTVWREVDPEDKTYLVQTSKGNRILCEECFDQITAPEVRSRIPNA
jgi:hypothetical protein